MSERPNVVVFLTDQQRADTSGLHGCPLELTPNFDAFAEAGTHLAQHVTSQPVCAPARGCFQTGQYATNHGVWGNQQHLPAHAKGIADLFQEAGYATGYFGKWHLAPNAAGDHPQAVEAPYRTGYDTWLGANIHEFCSSPYHCRVYDENQRPHDLPGYRVDAITDAAIRFIGAHRDEPFFLFVSILEPHHQNELFDYVPPDHYRARYAGRWLPPDLAQLPGNGPKHFGGYAGTVKRCDEAFGRVLDALKSLGLREATNVCYTSDHGCHFSTRPGMDKRSCHEASIRVPTALGGPAFDGGGRVEEPTTLLELPPTLLASAGIPVPASFDAAPLQPLLETRPARRPERDAYVQITNGKRVGRALRTRRWKYAVWQTADAASADGTASSYTETELYDLAHDPYELCNRIEDGDLAETRRELRERLLARLREAGEPEPAIEPPVAGSGHRGGRY